MGCKCWTDIYVPHDSHLSEKNKHVEEDDIVRLADMETMECDVQEVASTPKGTQNTFRTGKFHSNVQIGNDYEPSGQVHRHSHQRRHMRSMSPRSEQKNSVSFLLLNSYVHASCSGSYCSNAVCINNHVFFFLMIPALGKKKVTV